MLKINDRVKSDNYGVGEVVLIEDDDIIVAFDEYSVSLSPCEEVDWCDLQECDDRFYGSFSEDELRLYTKEEELKDIDEQIECLQEKRKEILESL